MTIPNCNVMVVCSWIAKGNWNVYLDNFLSKFIGDEVVVFVHQIQNIFFSPRYDYIVLLEISC